MRRTRASFNVRFPAGRLTVRGWQYAILTGRIEEYEEGMNRFEPLVG